MSLEAFNRLDFSPEQRVLLEAAARDLAAGYGMPIEEAAWTVAQAVESEVRGAYNLAAALRAAGDALRAEQERQAR